MDYGDIKWQEVEAALEKSPDKLEVIFRMEETGGEPDVVSIAKHGDSSAGKTLTSGDSKSDTAGSKKDGKIIFIDCSAESPEGRRNTCWDRAAQMSRKEDSRPEKNVVDQAAEIGVELLDEAQYRELQKHGEFDLKTSSWIKTPEAIRKLGGALFCDRRYNNVFTYHNGVQSYYSSRGFRGLVEI